MDTQKEPQRSANRQGAKRMCMTLHTTKIYNNLMQIASIACWALAWTLSLLAALVGVQLVALVAGVSWCMEHLAAKHEEAKNA